MATQGHSNPGDYRPSSSGGSAHTGAVVNMADYRGALEHRPETGKHKHHKAASLHGRRLASGVHDPWRGVGVRKGH